MENKDIRAIVDELIDIASELPLEEQTIILSIAKSMKFIKETRNNNKVNFKDNAIEKIKDMPRHKVEKVLEFIEKIESKQEVNKQSIKFQSIWKQK